MKVKTAILFILLFFICNANANIVSNLQGELSVNSGTLNYNIPLNVPVGTAGIQPKVSLFYSSNGLNGYFGEGWNISGLSSISRCASNVALDSKRKSVTYDNSDNICLDGQRLALVSGSQWGSNSEYRTKIDTYSKIVYDGVNFRVWTKAGDIKEYTLMNGNWFLSKISDRFENSIKYNYSSNSNGIYLNEIRYSDNKIKLNYEDKLDKSHSYTNGNKTEITKRVKSIEIESANQILRTYTLTYLTQANSVNKSILHSLTECSNDSCLEPLKFDYTHEEEKFVEGSADPKMKIAGIIYLDFNGDGHVDIYNDNSISYGEGNGQFSEWKSTGTNIANDKMKFADFDGDGDIDILSIYSTSQPVVLGATIAPARSTPNYCYLNDNGAFIRTLVGSINNTGKITDMKLADFNADGYVDMYINNEIYLRNENGIFNLTTKLDINAKNEDIYLVDLNGDGFTDIYEIKNGIDNIYISMMAV